MRVYRFNENLTDVPQIGDYVICKEEFDYVGITNITQQVIDYLNNTIGQIINKNRYFFIVEYKNIPKNIDNFFCSDTNGHDYSDIVPINGIGYRKFRKGEILYHSKNKEDVQTMKTSSNYNL